MDTSPESPLNEILLFSALKPWLRKLESPRVQGNTDVYRPERHDSDKKATYFLWSGTDEECVASPRAWPLRYAADEQSLRPYMK